MLEINWGITLVTRKIINPLLATVQQEAARMHSGINYGQSDMYAQVYRTAEIVYQATGDIDLTKAAFMHKALEGKRIVGGQPMDPEHLKILIGEKYLAIIQEFQDYDDRTDKLPQSDKVNQAAKLSDGAKILLMAEKIANFETSTQSPNPKKPLSWHARYFETRMEVARAAKMESQPQMSLMLEQSYDAGVEALKARIDKRLVEQGSNLRIAALLAQGER